MSLSRNSGLSALSLKHYKKKGTNVVIGIIYIDDALFCGPNKAVVDSIKAQFMCKWECRDLREPNEFLRMSITHKGRAIHLDQCTYLQKVIECCGMLNAKSASTPLLAGYYAAKNTEPVDAELHSRFQMVPVSHVGHQAQHCFCSNPPVVSLRKSLTGPPK